MRNELLTAETGVHAHEQHQVEFMDNVLEQVHRCRWVKGNTGHHSGILYLCNGTVQVRAGLVVDIHNFCAQILYRRQIVHWFNYHKMHIKRFLAQFGNIFEHRRAEREVWDEHAVHNINVQPLARAAVNHLQILL